MTENPNNELTAEERLTVYVETQRLLAHPDNPINHVHDGPPTVATERSALLELLHGGPQTMSELGRRVPLSRAAITALTDRLEESELVRRVAHPGDRRKTMLELTEDGAMAAREAIGFEPDRTAEEAHNGVASVVAA